VEKEIYTVDPFVTVDREGVGRLMRIAIEDGRRTQPGLKLGICGEHGGDPSSVEFCDEVGLDYVSCSPFRIPIARLAAAQATLKARKAATEAARRKVEGEVEQLVAGVRDLPRRVGRQVRDLEERVEKGVKRIAAALAPARPARRPAAGSRSPARKAAKAARPAKASRAAPARRKAAGAAGRTVRKGKR
jgi:hypothetical protein